MTAETSISSTDEQKPDALNGLSDADIDALRTLIDQRRKGPFVDFEQGKADILEMLAHKRKARGL